MLSLCRAPQVRISSILSLMVNAIFLSDASMEPVRVLNPVVISSWTSESASCVMVVVRICCPFKNER